MGSSNIEMLRLFLSGRADYFFAAEEEAKEMISSAGYSISQFKLHHFSDVPPGNMRDLACSQQVPFEMIERVNDYLK